MERPAIYWYSKPDDPFNTRSADLALRTIIDGPVPPGAYADPDQLAADTLELDFKQPSGLTLYTHDPFAWEMYGIWTGANADEHTPADFDPTADAQAAEQFLFSIHQSGVDLQQAA